MEKAKEVLGRLRKRAMTKPQVYQRPRPLHCPPTPRRHLLGGEDSRHIILASSGTRSLNTQHPEPVPFPCAQRVSSSQFRSRPLPAPLPPGSNDSLPVPAPSPLPGQTCRFSFPLRSLAGGFDVFAMVTESPPQSAPTCLSNNMSNTLKGNRSFHMQSRHLCCDPARVLSVCPLPFPL